MPSSIGPSDAVAGWERTDLWDSAAAIPGVHVMTDEGGAQARVFGALVSGQTLLYGATGSLLFSGGITGARGHEGDNPGRTALTSILDWRPAGPIRTPVFGCYLYAEADVTRQRTDAGAAMTPRPHTHAVAPPRSRNLLRERQRLIFKQTDRMFAVLMAVQWVFGMAVAVLAVAEDLGRDR